MGEAVRKEMDVLQAWQALYVHTCLGSKQGAAYTEQKKRIYAHA